MIGGTATKKRSELAWYARNNKSELRAQAAVMWVDMEDGLIPKPAGDAGKGAWPSKNLIVQSLGFAGTLRYMPAFVSEPEFGRAVEFERIKRVAQGSSRMSKDEIAVLASMIARAGMIEAARRFVLEPEKIGTRDLLPETRNYAKLAAEVQGSDGAQGSVHQTINLFVQASDRLPPKARAKFLGIFDDSMRRMALAAGEAREKAGSR